MTEILFDPETKRLAIRSQINDQRQLFSLLLEAAGAVAFPPKQEPLVVAPPPGLRLV